MSLKTKLRDQLYAMHPYRLGRVEVAALRGFFNLVEKIQGQGVSVPDLTIAPFTAQTSTAADVDAAGAGRLYFVWAKSPAGSTLDVIVQIVDNSIVIGSFKLVSTKAGEAYFYCASDGCGLKYGTNLKVKAVAAADGTSNPAAGDRPDIVVVWGDDAINTDERNLAVSTYG